MKRSQILMSILALVSMGMTARAEDVPKRLSFERYAGMLEKSPFAIATAVAAPAATPTFAKDLYLGSAAKSPDGDMLTVLSSSDKNFRKYLTTRGPEDGYTIANIEWSDRVGETKATISKDGQFATIGFNQSLLSQPGPSAPMQPPSAKEMGVPPPVAAPLAPPMPVKPNAQAVPAPNPHTRGVIKRNPSGAQTTPPQSMKVQPTDVDE